MNIAGIALELGYKKGRLRATEVSPSVRSRFPLGRVFTAETEAPEFRVEEASFLLFVSVVEIILPIRDNHLRHAM